MNPNRITVANVEVERARMRETARDSRRARRLLRGNGVAMRNPVLSYLRWR